MRSALGVSQQSCSIFAQSMSAIVARKAPTSGRKLERNITDTGKYKKNSAKRSQVLLAAHTVVRSHS